MSQRTILLKISTSAFLVFSACSLKAPNIEWCRDKGSLGAHCNKTNSDEPRDIRQPEWDSERFGMFCTDEQGFAKNQLFIEQACEMVKGCEVEKLREEYLKLIERMK